MPIPFTCPHCGAQTSVADQYAGQTGPCATCGKPITVPGGMGQAATMVPPPSRSSPWGVILVIVAVGGVLMLLVCAGLLLPAIQAAREAARRTSCICNMKQIGLAVHNFHDARKQFPTYVDPRAPEGQPTSWRVQVLPYIEQNYLYDQYDPSQPWDSPTNRQLADPMPTTYRCPGNPNHDLETDYLAVVGPHAAFRDKGKVGFREIRDGLSNTIMVVESHPSGVHWMEPADAPAEDFAPSGAAPLSSVHPGVANVLFADGSVRSLRDDIDPDVLHAMTTADGGEAIPPGGY